MQKYKKIILALGLCLALNSNTAMVYGTEMSEPGEEIVINTEIEDELEDSTEENTEVNTEIDEETNNTSFESVQIAEKVLKADGYYAIEDLSVYKDGLSFEINVKEDITRIEVIYTTTQPKINFIDNKQNIYENMNKTYGTMSLLQREKTEVYKEKNITYYMDVYYINSPKNVGTWTMNVTNVQMIDDIVVAETNVPYGWEIASVEPKTSISGGVWYHLKNTSILTTLLEANAEEEVKSENDTDFETTTIIEEIPYETYVMIGICAICIGIIAYNIFSKRNREKKIREIEQKNLEERKRRKEERKQIKKEQEKQFRQEFLDNEDWSDVKIDWDVTPKTKKVEDVVVDTSNKIEKVEQIKKNNSIFADRKQDDVTSKTNEQPKTPIIPNIPNVPNIPNDNSGGGFF